MDFKKKKKKKKVEGGLHNKFYVLTKLVFDVCFILEW